MIRRGLRGKGAVAAVLSIGAFVLVCACAGSGDTPEPAPEVQPPALDPAPVDTSENGEGAEDAEPTVAPLRSLNVRLFFPSALENGLIAEHRQIFDTATPGDRAKQIIADLITGPTSDKALRSVPQNTILLQVFVLPDGTAYLDFSPSISQIGGGSMEEILTIYSIVDSVVLNVPEIVRVAILVNGNPIDTLNGHVDLRRPLSANPSLILGSIVVESRAGVRGVRAA